MRRLAPGQVLRLTALDPGAPADIPAWCRMTRHHLVFIDPVAQLYFIQRP
jgi:tRNA 2-thiouridine synthesizing protein A